MTFIAERTFAKKGGKKAPTPAAPTKYEKMRRLSAQDAEFYHADAIARGAKCQQCPLFGLKAGPIPSEFHSHPRLTIIAETPEENDLQTRRPFSSDSGALVFDALFQGGVLRSETNLTHVCACRPPEELQAFNTRVKILHEVEIEKWKDKLAEALATGQPPPPEPIQPLTPQEACAPRLKRDLDEAKTPVILALGKESLSAVGDFFQVPVGAARKVKKGEIRFGSLQQQLGAPTTMADGRIVIATHHPKFGVKPGSKQYGEVIEGHIARAAKIVERGYINWKEPDYILNPTVEQIESTLKSFYGHDKVIDIETDQGSRPDGGFDPHSCKIRCIGIGAKVNGEEKIIVVPIRHMADGSDWWGKEDKIRILTAVINCLNEESWNVRAKRPVRLVGHNLAFDTMVLLRYKLLLKRDRLFEDTMLLHHDTLSNDRKHDLGFCAQQYFEVPCWKSSADDKFYIDLTDADLHLYNAKDILTCMRLFEVLTEEMYACGTVEQYQQDQQIAIIARDMGVLGVFIDETQRGILSTQMNKLRFERLMDLRNLLGKPDFNPDSPPQVRKYLFKEKGLVPVLNTKQKDWAEGEDPATNTQALSKLVAAPGTPPEVVQFVSLLFEYRQYSKLCGTYLNSLKVSYDTGLPNLNVAGAVMGQKYVKYSSKKKKEPDGFSKEEIAEKRYPIEWKASDTTEPANDPTLEGLEGKERTKHLRQLEEQYFLSAEQQSFKYAEKSKLLKTVKTQRRAARKALLARIEDGAYQLIEVIAQRPTLSRLHTTYKVHVIPSGRLSTVPAIQNWPERGKANMREMVVAPPGHVLVGADLDQVELRLYAIISGDKLLLEAFEKGYDPHSYNAASMFASQFAKEWKRPVSIFEAYEWIIGLPTLRATEAAHKTEAVDVAIWLEKLLPLMVVEKSKEDRKLEFAELQVPSDIGDAIITGWTKGEKEKKKLRGYAKTFAYLECLPGDTLILTDKGEVPLREITTDHKIWDGIDWRTHDGVICKGFKRVLTYDGLTATPDHIIWTACGQKMSLEQAARKQIKLARTSANRHPIQFLGHNDSDMACRSPSESRSRMPWLSKKKNSVFRQYQSRKIQELPLVRQTDKKHSRMASFPRKLYAATLYQSKKPRIRALWRAWDRIQILFHSCRRAVDSRQLRLTERQAARPHRQQWPLRAGKFAVGDGSRQQHASKQYDCTSRFRLSTRRLAFYQETRIQAASKRNEQTRYHCLRSILGSYTRNQVAYGAEKVAVYDILNAGPLHRFTANSVLVSNCYGGEAETLYSQMSTARDKTSGSLMFPGLLESDVQEWHKQWHMSHPETKAWQDLCRRVAKQLGCTSAAYGTRRKRFFRGGANKAGATFNHVIQSTAAEIANAALIEIALAIPFQSLSPYTGICLQVHDYIGVYVPKEYEKFAKEVIQKAMNRVVLNMAITSKAKSSHRWSEQ